jgi:hypothetical protein
MRLGRIQQQLKEAGASEIILKAIQGEEAIAQRARTLVVSVIETAQELLESIRDNKDGAKSSTQASTLNNLCFAMSNIGRFVDAVGLVGMPQELRNSKRNGAAGPDGQPWEKGMLQQINVTVKNIQASAEAAKSASEPAIEAEPAP